MVQLSHKYLNGSISDNLGEKFCQNPNPNPNTTQHNLNSVIGLHTKMILHTPPPPTITPLHKLNGTLFFL